MATAIKFDEEPVLSYSKKLQLKVSFTILGNEAKHGLKDHGASEDGKPNSHSTLSALTVYLKANPIVQPMEVLYLKNATTTLLANYPPDSG